MTRSTLQVIAQLVLRPPLRWYIFWLLNYISTNEFQHQFWHYCFFFFFKQCRIAKIYHCMCVTKKKWNDPNSKECLLPDDVHTKRANVNNSHHMVKHCIRICSLFSVQIIKREHFFFFCSNHLYAQSLLLLWNIFVFRVLYK